MQEAILVHEWVQVERGDWLATAFEQMVRAILWFHPAIPFLLDRIQLSREQTVDSAVVQYTGRTRIYLESLCHAASTFRRASLAATIPFMRASHLRQRVVALTEEVCMSQCRQACVCAVLVVAAAALSAAAAVVARPAPGNPQPGVGGEPVLPA
jgi:beta-lactamase regulating signal transducer with metallopeptidase domain